MRVCFPSHCECSILKSLLSSLLAFEEEVVGLVPSLACSGLLGGAGSKKVHFNPTVFALHELCHNRLPGSSEIFNVLP